MPAPTAVVVGLDAGTSAAKAVAVDRAGLIAAAAESEPIPTSQPADGASVQDPEVVWQRLLEATRAVMAQLGENVPVEAISLAAQSGSVIPVLPGGEAKELITWMDTRSQSTVEGWDESTLDTIRDISGWSASPGLGLSTITWFGATLDTEVARWASVDDYLVWRLTDSWITNPSNAAGMQLIDHRTPTWSDSLCRIAGIDERQLASISRSGEVAGTITDHAARQMAIEPSTPLVTGGHDQACTALALGATEAGVAVVAMGTAWVVTIVGQLSMIDRPISPTFNVSHHVIDGRLTLSKNLGGIGAQLAAALDQGPSDSVANAIQAGSFAVRQAFDEAIDAGVKPNVVIAVGGATQSPAVTQAIADAINLPITVRSDASWPALGAALLAAQTIGWDIEVGADVATSRVAPSPSAVATATTSYAAHRARMAGSES